MRLLSFALLAVLLAVEATVLIPKAEKVNPPGASAAAADQLAIWPFRRRRGGGGCGGRGCAGGTC